MRKGEHVIPDAIGGVRTFKEVCARCNSGVLSSLDRELCSASPVAIIAGEVLGNGIGQTWDVDHHDGNVLLEAAPSWIERSMIVWPQIIVTNSGPEIRGDYEEMQQVGQEAFHRILVHHMRRAYYRWRTTRKGLFFRQLQSANDMLKTYRYPPRIFAERRVLDFTDDMTFVIGYEDNNDKRRALHTIDQWDSGKSFKRFEVQLGSHLPAVRRYWDLVKIVRALTKMGINLLHDTCDHTIVNRETFSKAIAFVLGEFEVQPSNAMFRQSGFIRPADLDGLHRDDGGHFFRLVHDGGCWRLWSSLFGGRVCSTVRFPGPSYETWTTADIGTPLVSSDRDVSGEWRVSHYASLLPIRTHVEWTDPKRVIPSVEMLNTSQRIDVRAIPRRTKG